MTEGARNSPSQCNRNNCREGAHLEYDAARDLGVHLGFGDDLPDCRTVQVEALGTIGVKTAAKVGGEKATGAIEGARQNAAKKAPPAYEQARILQLLHTGRHDR